MTFWLFQAEAPLAQPACVSKVFSGRCHLSQLMLIGAHEADKVLLSFASEEPPGSGVIEPTLSA
jgi:hypothetical protein